MEKFVINTAGERESEKRSRVSNLVEGLSVVSVLLVLLWPIAYAGHILGGQVWFSTMAYIGIALAFGFMLFVSPFFHGDRAGSWGLGNPRTLWRMLTSGSPGKRLSLAVVVLTIFGLLNLVNLMHWPRVARFFGLQRLGLSSDPLLWHLYSPEIYLVVAAGLVISVFFVGFLIRYDNFLTAFRTALRISLPFLALIFLAAWLQRGSAAFAGLSLSGWLLGVFGYLFWGAFQQIVFSGYFGTRFRKAFGPGENPGNQVLPGRRLMVTVVFGGAVAVGGTLTIVAAIVSQYGFGHLDPDIIIWLGVILFATGAAYGFWFCRDKRRLLVATLGGACFGLVHIDSYGLVVVTWGLGTVLLYIFMEEKNRNVVALGFIHGLLGSTLSTLFSKNQSGVVEIDYHVGPWNIEVPTGSVLIFPCLGIALFLFFIIRNLRKVRRAEVPEESGAR